MDDENATSWRAQSEKLRQQNDDLKLMLSVLKENYDLRSKLYDCSSVSDSDRDHTGRKTTLQWKDTVDEDKFHRYLFKKPFRTSSPMNVQISDKDPPESNIFPQGDPTPNCSHTHQSVKDPERLVGEIAFQLDRRILSCVFQDQNRLYGFTVQNIPDKIVQVSTHPVTGKEEKIYRRQLSKRHKDLMDRLNTLEYSMTLHPPFTEFVINTYGILKQRPNASCALELGYNNPDLLRRVIVDTAPSKMVKDLLILLNCLCFMARQDGKALFLW